MFQEQSYTVDFYNGPFDGHTERLNLQPEFLPEHLICYIGPDTLRRIHGAASSDQETITSVVIYAKHYRAGSWMYRFVQAIAPENVSIHPV